MYLFLLASVWQCACIYVVSPWPYHSWKKYSGALPRATEQVLLWAVYWMAENDKSWIYKPWWMWRWRLKPMESTQRAQSGSIVKLRNLIEFWAVDGLSVYTWLRGASWHLLVLPVLQLRKWSLHPLQVLYIACQMLKILGTWTSVYSIPSMGGRCIVKVHRAFACVRG